MKTNHRRGFRASNDKVNVLDIGNGVRAKISNRRVGPKSFGIPDTEREARKARRGAKKFVVSRTRFHENAATRQLARESE